MLLLQLLVNDVDAAIAVAADAAVSAIVAAADVTTSSHHSHASCQATFFSIVLLHKSIILYGLYTAQSVIVYYESHPQTIAEI